MKQTFLILLLLLSGCGLFEIDQSKVNKEDTKQVQTEVTEVQNNIHKALKDASKEDCERIYKILVGCSDYLDNTSKLTKFSEVLELLAKVKDDYNWKTDTYSELSDVIEKQLTNKGYEEDFTLSKEKRAEVIGVFKEMADGVLLALKDKDANS